MTESSQRPSQEPPNVTHGEGKPPRLPLPEWIRLKRFAAGLSQEELAKRLGVTQGAVSQWELGNWSPGSGRVPDLARVFDLTPEEVAVAVVLGEGER